MSEPLPPRIPRAEAIGPSAIRTRLYDIEQENDRVLADIESCNNDLKTLLERNRDLVAEHEKLARKLMLWEDS
jgi:regulator of replication initiation timing